MSNKEKLYKSFARLIFALIGKDDTIKKSDAAQIEDKLISHKWRGNASWTFNTRTERDENIDELFDELIKNCEKNGADREYEFLIDVLEDVVAASKDKILVTSILQNFEAETERINREYAKPPHLVNVLLESRLLLEWPSMALMHKFLPKRIEGENHPVLLLPPFLWTDAINVFIRKYLTRQGFTTYKWELGINLIRAHDVPPLEQKLDVLFKQHKEKISLVGWSGGGILGKVLANRHPDKVAQLITIGTPIWGLENMKTFASVVHQRLGGNPAPKKKNEDFYEELSAIPDVPITCIYTKTDGIVPWKHCLEVASLRPDIQNIEVFGSHNGLGANATVLLAVAQALHQNLNGEEVREIPEHIERIFYPAYWKKRKTIL